MLWDPRAVPGIPQTLLRGMAAPVKNTTLPKKTFLVAIDPGHGGEDKGARGVSGSKEKDIVLDIARKTKNILSENKSIQAIILRKGDYFLSIKHRCKLAHYNRADLLISIHANANEESSVHGVSVYYLSEGGASDRASELIASRENASDLIEGFSYSEDPMLDTVLVDLMQVHSINQSKLLGKYLLDSLVEHSGRRSLGLLSADFGVLKLPNIPSVLIEAAFITNPEEEKLLSSSSFQTRVAESLALGIEKYIKNLSQPTYTNF